VGQIGNLRPIGNRPGACGAREPDTVETDFLMSQVDKIQSQIRNLSSSDLAAFREWFAEFDASAWDRQFAADVEAGKSDSLSGQALHDHAAGRSREL
jgi:hypothetical protein